MPDYLISQSPDRIVLRNFEGVITTYKEPEDYKNECKCVGCQDEPEELIGVAGLLAGQRMTLEPVGLPRNSRKHKE
ncbi:MAG: lysine 2,3-aminomutase, partial [Chloroflexi bacterium]|nr:lysine 2,3-aminomutase [Chloroflexota bacterium]